MSIAVTMADDFKPDTIFFQSDNLKGTTSLGSTSMSAVPTIPLSATKIIRSFLDHLSMAAPEKLDAMWAEFFDGLALGAVERFAPDASDLPDLIGDLKDGLGKDETASVMFDLGRELGQELDGGQGMGVLSLPDATGDDLPNSADLGQNTTVSAMDVFGAVRDPLSLIQESIVEHPSLQAGHAWSSANDPSAPVPEPVDHGEAAKDLLEAGIVSTLTALGTAIVALAAAPAEAAFLTGVAATALAVGIAFAAAAVAHAIQDAIRPTDDGPTADEIEISLEETFKLLSQEVGGLVLKFSEDMGVEPPEDMPAFEAAVRQALWDAVSRPSGTEDEADSGAIDDGLNPEDLQHDLDPDTEIGIPLPEGTNPDEPYDPTGGAVSIADDGFLF